MISFDLKGKVVVVTGGESGIGRAIALACSEAEAEVCVAGLVSTGLDETVAFIEKIRGPDTALAIQTDIQKPDEVERLFEVCVRRFGRLDAVVANAGVLPPLAAAHEVTLEEWTRTINVNLTGAFLTVSIGARYLIEQGQGGSIVATGSSIAVRPVPGAIAYAASKGGVHAMMQCLALELGVHRIRVNTLVPGQTNTAALRAIPGYIERAARLLPLGEVVEPDEIGRYVAFSLSDAVPHLTGSQLRVDSGRTIG